MAAIYMIIYVIGLIVMSALCTVHYIEEAEGDIDDYMLPYVFATMFWPIVVPITGIFIVSFFWIQLVVMAYKYIKRKVQIEG
jgi:hypothetical protein